MKGKRYLLIGLVFGIMIGWALGFLRLPYIEKNFSFLLGFIAALVLVSLLLVLLNVWNQNLLFDLTRKRLVTGDPQKTRMRPFIRIMLVGILAVGGIVGGLIVYRQNESFKLQIQNQDKKVQEMAALVEYVKENDLEPLMLSILDDVKEELKRNPRRTLSDTMITRIAALSFAFKSYKYIEHDTLSNQESSPDRGQLLQALILMNIDSSSFAKIKKNAVFARADLRGANLKGGDMSGINLKGANLRGADLSGANLKGANLEGANLWEVNLNQANLSGTNLKKTDLRWAHLNKAILTLSNLNGANLQNAQLIKADFNTAMFQWAQLDGALFNEANLSSVDFTGTNFTKVNLSKANLSRADLRKVNLSEADLGGAQFFKAVVDKNWLEDLQKWQPTGLKELLENYTIVNDTANKFQTPMYRLYKN